jgi:hypothetical protein
MEHRTCLSGTAFLGAQLFAVPPLPRRLVLARWQEFVELVRREYGDAAKVQDGRSLTTRTPFQTISVHSQSNFEF